MVLFEFKKANPFDEGMGKKKQSAGLLMYAIAPGQSLKLLIAHPGGPIFRKKQEGYWGIPKGEFEDGELPFDAALREFEEETGLKPDADGYTSLGNIVQKGGKTVHAWAFEGQWSEGRELICNEIDLEWPPHSGLWHRIPEIDEVKMVEVDQARNLMRPEQFVFVERLCEVLAKQQKLDLIHQHS